MTRSNHVVRQIALQSKIFQPICKSCLLSLQRLSSTAAVVASLLPESDLEPPIVAASSSHPQVSAAVQSPYKIKAGVLLSRPPILTRDLTPFEKAYFLYQKRLNERLVLPFTRYFYYKRDTPEDVVWKNKIKLRRTAAKDIGVYDAYSKDGWNDEVLIGSNLGEPEEQIKALVSDAITGKDEEDEEDETERPMHKVVEHIDEPMPRVTEADRTGDLKSLNRALTRTLYLVVKEGHEKGRWVFPSSELIGNESLHIAAERTLIQSAGPNMNTWVVGNVPIAHQTVLYPIPITNPETGAELLGEKIFFMKARIMAGQANLKGNEFGFEDFKWLAKDEMERLVRPSTWKNTKHVLAER